MKFVHGIFVTLALLLVMISGVAEGAIVASGSSAMYGGCGDPDIHGAAKLTNFTTYTVSSTGDTAGFTVPVGESYHLSFWHFHYDGDGNRVPGTGESMELQELIGASWVTIRSGVFDEDGDVYFPGFSEVRPGDYYYRGYIPGDGWYSNLITVHVVQFKIYNIIDEDSKNPSRAERDYMVGGNLEFDASGFIDASNPSPEFSWNFGDDTGPTPWSINPIQKHVFKNPQLFTVILSIRSGPSASIATAKRDLDLSLEVGDILIRRARDGWIPGYWTHCAIYVGEGKVVESYPSTLTERGVHLVNLDRQHDGWYYPDHTWVSAFRVTTADTTIKSRAAQFARIIADQPFTHFDSIQEMNEGKSISGPGWYCAELVWASYLWASDGSINIEDGPDTWAITPTEIANDDDLELIGYHHERDERAKGPVIRAHCPIDLIVEDPAGQHVSKGGGTINGAIYIEDDEDGDGEADDIIGLPAAMSGNYQITVVPETNASSTDTFSLDVELPDNTTFLLANNTRISDISTDPYVVSFLMVQVMPGVDVPPTDLNNDGIYEDVNGNGRADFADVVLFFNQMAWIAANEPVSALDYNGNSRIDFADVVWLFNHL